MFEVACIDNRGKGMVKQLCKVALSLRTVCFGYPFLLRPVFLLFSSSFFFFFFKSHLSDCFIGSPLIAAITFYLAVVSIVRLLLDASPLHNNTCVSAIPSRVCNFLRLYFPPRSVRMFNAPLH